MFDIVVVGAGVVGALIAAALLGSAGVVLCRDDEDQASESQL